tara:strand:- start:64 stop:486 length:423 start_codon:yes stop_codon:yes gene_type:complete
MTNIQKLQLILGTPQLQKLRYLAEETEGYFKIILNPSSIWMGFIDFENPKISVRIGNFEGVICLELWNAARVTIAPKFHQPLTNDWLSDEEDSALMIFSTLHKLCWSDKLQKEMKSFLEYSDKFITSDPIPSDWQFDPEY